MSHPLPARARIALALLWAALLALAGWWVAQHLAMSTDLRRFMPAPQTGAQKLLIEELGEGPGSRLLLVAIAGAPPATLAAQSRSLQAALAADPRFALAANGGDATLEAIPERLRPYRYLLASPRLDRASLEDALAQRLQDLGSPAAMLVEPLLPSDPTLEVLRLAEGWQPAHGPQRLEGVWFDRAGTQALLLAQTHAAGFDPDGQQAALQALQQAFDRASAGSGSRLTVTGPGAFGVEIAARTRREASLIGSVDTVALLLLLAFAYRSLTMPLLGALPLASAGLAGLAAVALLFESVHGITIAFGFTLIGVVQDYPIHLFSHQRAGVSAWANARGIWPTLATGVVATCIAYATFFAAGVDGLRQLAVFTIVALAVAALATRFALPGLLPPDARDPARSPALARLWRWIGRLPRPRWSLAVLAVAALAGIALAPGNTWQNDLSRLTPVPAAAMQADMQLRRELGAPDVRYVLAIGGDDAQAVLERSEALVPVLDALVRDGALAGYDLAARYLPSARVQQARQAQLPDAATLQADLQAAAAASGFREDAFAPFLADVQRARSGAPLAPSDIAGTPLETRVGGLLLEREGHATALVSLAGLHDPAAVARATAAGGAQLMDLKQASESLVAAYRQRVLAALGLAAGLLALTVWIALRSPRRVWRVLLPMALTTLLVVAVLRLVGIELNLFHLVALVLAAGLGLDYALFFEHAGEDRDDQLRTLHALLVCSAMTLLVFSLLAMSSIPVLRALGLPVALGVAGNFVLGLLVSRHATGEAAA